MRNRGLKRYFRNLNKKEVLEHLNFSGSADSWFDLYHLHIDNKGLGNISWKARKQHLDALFGLADRVQEKLAHYQKDYQFWIQIDENDSSEDAIYIHTANPNGSNFPIKLVFDSQAEINKKMLFDYLKQKEYKIEKLRLSDVDGGECTTYFLYKDGLGIKII